MEHMNNAPWRDVRNYLFICIWSDRSIDLYISALIYGSIERSVSTDVVSLLLVIYWLLLIKIPVCDFLFKLQRLISSIENGTENKTENRETSLCQQGRWRWMKSRPAVQGPRPWGGLGANAEYLCCLLHIFPNRYFVFTFYELFWQDIKIKWDVSFIPPTVVEFEYYSSAVDPENPEHLDPKQSVEKCTKWKQIPHLQTVTLSYCTRTSAGFDLVCLALCGWKYRFSI